MPLGSAVVIAMIAACSAQAPDRDQNLANATVMNGAVPPESPSSQAAPAPGTPAGLPDDRTPQAEPKGPIDAASAEAAGQVVQRYGALIEQKKFNIAAGLWEDAKEADSFAKRFSDYREVHLQVGKPGNMEGAAGSVYVTVPVSLYGTSSAGSPFKCSGEATLRRVNDVPGSTAEQREWHIHAIEC
jgi:hypothetical protein